MPRGHWFGVTVALYLLWMLVTYRLEGRRRTLLRVEARGDGLKYTLSANVLIGIVGSAGLLVWMRAFEFVTLEQAGFQETRHGLVFTAAGLGIGAILLAFKRPPGSSPTVLFNAFCQVLPVSIAEVLICWSVAGSMTESVIGAGRPAGVIAAFVGSAVLFGVYHFAHSPPFNTRRMAGFLVLTGLVTSLFFHTTRDIDGTIAFHNMLATTGVMSSLHDGGGLHVLRRPRMDLAGSAILAVLALLVVQAVLAR